MLVILVFIKNLLCILSETETRPSENVSEMVLRSLWLAPVFDTTTQHAAVQHNTVNFDNKIQKWMLWYEAISVSIWFLNDTGDGSQNLIDVIIIPSVLTTCFSWIPACLMLLFHWVTEAAAKLSLGQPGRTGRLSSPSLCNSSAPHLPLWFARRCPPHNTQPQSYLALAVWCFSSGAISEWNRSSPLCSWSDPAVQQHFA